MAEPAIKIEQPVPETAQTKTESSPWESMSDFTARMSQEARGKVQSSTEQALKIAQGDAAVQREIGQSQTKTLRDLEKEKAKVDRKLDRALGADWRLVELGGLLNVKPPANDNERAALAQAIKEKKVQFERLAGAELKPERAEVLELEIKLFEQIKERDAIQSSIQKTEQELDRLAKALERAQKKSIPDPLELASIEMDRELQEQTLERDNLKVLELGGSMVALDRLLTRTKRELKAAEEKLEQKELDRIHAKLEEIEQAERAQERARREEKRDRISKGLASGWSVGKGAAGAVIFLGFSAIAKAANWLDKGLDYLFKYDWVDKLINIAKLPVTIVDRAADWIEKKLGFEPTGKERK